MPVREQQYHKFRSLREGGYIFLSNVLNMVLASGKLMQIREIK